MSMMNLYVVKDNLQDFKSQIFTAPNDDYMRRLIPEICKYDELMTRYPNDFTLYRVGQLNFESGIITPEITPVFICSMAERRTDELA